MKVNKQIIETIKTIVIVALITGIITFVLGMRYANGQTQRIQEAVKSVQSK